MDNHFRFTKRAIEDLPLPPLGKRAYYHDTATRGLCLSVTPAGTRSFYLYRWIQGKPERVLLGRFPDLTIENARGKASAANARIAAGENPQDTRRAVMGEPTLGQLFAEFRERHLVPYRKTSTREGYEWQFGKFLAAWRNRKLSAIRRKEVQVLHSKIGKESGHYMANRILALLSALYSKAQAWGLWSGDNPAQGVERFRERSRSRFIQKDELPRFFKALAEEPNTTARDCILLCLLTGARRANVQAMRWDQLELDKAIWAIPDTKSGEPQTVPLVPMAIEILSRRAQEGEWVFPGPGKSQHLVELKSVWQRVTRRAELEDLRLHDLRRTMGSWQAITGATLTVIGKSLGHKTPSATLIYSRLSEDPVRQAMERATEAMWRFADQNISSPTTGSLGREELSR